MAFQRNFEISVDQHSYMRNEIAEIEIAAARRRQKDSPITDKERSTYRSVVHKLAWVLLASPGL